MILFGEKEWGWCGKKIRQLPIVYLSLCFKSEIKQGSFTEKEDMHFGEYVIK